MDVLVGLFAFGLVGFLLLAWFRFVLRPRTARNIANKHVIVTGGSQGIGLWAASRAAQLGANVTLVARNLEQLEKAKEQVESHRLNADRQTVRIASLDVCSAYEKIAERFAQLELEAGPIDVLVNCAGMAECATIDATSVEMARRMMEVNYFGTFQPTRYAIESMRSRCEADGEQANGGVIVLTSSMAGLLGVYGMGAYCASKFALRGLAESLALENAHLNIRVTVAFPGDTDTPGFERENIDKPLITKLMSSEGGLVDPRLMGKHIFDDAMYGNFCSVYDIGGFVVALLGQGLAPWGGFLEAMLLAPLMVFLRPLGWWLSRGFRKLVRTELAKQAKSK